MGLWEGTDASVSTKCPVPTSLSSVHVNQLIWFGEAPVRGLLQLQGWGECICSVTERWHGFITRLVLPGSSDDLA